jgi:hypothetical protein
VDKDEYSAIAQVQAVEDVSMREFAKHIRAMCDDRHFHPHDKIEMIKEMCDSVIDVKKGPFSVRSDRY